MNAKIHERVDGAEAKINQKMGIEYGDVPETKKEHGLNDMTADEWADSATNAVANVTGALSGNPEAMIKLGKQMYTGAGMAYDAYKETGKEVKDAEKKPDEPASKDDSKVGTASKKKLPAAPQKKRSKSAGSAPTKKK